MQASINVKTAKVWSFASVFHPKKKAQANLHLVDAQEVYQLLSFSQSPCVIQTLKRDCITVHSVKNESDSYEPLFVKYWTTTSNCKQP